MSTHLSVIIPAFNEKKNLDKGLLDQVFEYLSKQDYQWEVIISDDGSTDGSLIRLQQFAREHQQVKVLANKHGGKALAVTAGMLTAIGKWRLFTDFDQSTPISEVEKLLERATQGFDVIIGSREIVGARRDKEPWYRHFMGRGFNLLVQIVAVPGVLDTQCGFKLFSDKATNALFPKLVVYGQKVVFKDAFTGSFDVELLYLAIKYNFSIREVPIKWHHMETNRVSPLKDSIRMFRDLILIKLASLMGKYNEKL